jgi:hypothetical protein
MQLALKMAELDIGIIGEEISISDSEMAQPQSIQPLDHDYDASRTDLVDDDHVRNLVKKANSTSVIWDFFGYDADKNGHAIDNGKPRCRTCYKEVSNKAGNTSNLFKHLKDNHPSVHAKLKVSNYKPVT